MSNLIAKLPSRVLSDTRGSTAIIFALCLTPAVFLLGAAVDFSRSTALRQELKNAADAAVIAGVAAVAQTGATTAAAQTIAANVWTSNLSAQGVRGSTVATPTVTITNTSGQISGQIAYTASIPTTFSALSGKTSMAVSDTSSAQAIITTTRTTAVNGQAGALADPHVWSTVNNAGWAMQCPAGNWYNMLSDSGIEVNIACLEAGADAQFINSFAVSLGTTNKKTFMISIPQWDWGTGKAVGGTWTPGQITVNGTTQTQGYNTTTQLYDDGNGTTVTYAYKSRDFDNMDPNVLTVTTPVYSIQLFFQHTTLSGSHGSYNTPNGGTMTMTATGAGTCGAPGGVLGKTLVAVDDQNSSDFHVASAYATQASFNNACTTTVAKGTYLTH